MYRMTRIASLALIVAAAAPGAYAQSDNNPATSNILSGGLIVPYDGFLMLDGQPMNGPATIRFELWDDPASTTPARRVWGEDQTVTVFNGRFSVGLGATGNSLTNRAIADVVRDGEKLYLAILVRDANNNFVPLSGRQAIEPAPYAAWSASSADFDVGRNLTVGAALNVGTGAERVYIGNGAVSAAETVSGRAVNAGASGISSSGSISTNNNLEVKGNDLYLGTNVDSRGNGGRALVAGDSDTLIINFARDFPGGTQIQGNTSIVSGGLNVGGAINAGTNTVTGKLRGWRAQATGRNVSGNTNLGVNATDGVCFLSYMRIDHNERDPSPMACSTSVINGVWHLGVTQDSNSNRGDTDCAATCIIF